MTVIGTAEGPKAVLSANSGVYTIDRAFNNFTSEFRIEILGKEIVNNPACIQGSARVLEVLVAFSHPCDAPQPLLECGPALHIFAEITDSSDRFKRAYDLFPLERGVTRKESMTSGRDDNKEFVEWLQHWQRRIPNRVLVEKAHTQSKHLPNKVTILKRKDVIDASNDAAQLYGKQKGCDEHQQHV